MSPVPIGLGTLLETARSALAHGIKIQVQALQQTDVIMLSAPNDLDANNVEMPHLI